MKPKYERYAARLAWLEKYAPDMRAKIERGQLSIDGGYSLARKGLGSFEMIYFVQALGGGGPIKVGCAFDPYRRLKQLQMFSPVELALMGYLEGDRKDEKRLHRKMKKHRAWGEWFYPSPLLWRLIEAGAAYKERIEPRIEECMRLNRDLPRAVA